MANPTYLLVDVQTQIRALGRKAFTSTAIATAQDELGMTVEEMVGFICSRTDTTCFKTMESGKIPGVWMDVYNWLCPNKTQMAYVKVSLDPRSKVVISFKEL
ncbi:type II toxin-antitoxin system MqsR family toxin [Delftia deserti]|uniref:Type II toxin-antitoxin system MqsR family toxin n=1 Tax=Delftia deserti TaxID=1651218 RepID=A0ABW5EXB0_9BURK